MPRPPAPVPTADVIQKEREALELRRAGITFDAIAERLGYAGKSSAHAAVRRGLRRTLQEPADELRALELDRLERLQVAVWAKAMRGDLQAVDRVLRISERRSRLMGLDLPTLAEADRNKALQELADAQAQTITWLIQSSLSDLGVDMTEDQVVQVVSSRLEELRGAPTVEDEEGVA